MLEPDNGEAAFGEFPTTPRHLAQIPVGDLLDILMKAIKREPMPPPPEFIE